MKNTKSNPEKSGINEAYGNRVRVRISGLCWQDKRLLLVNHRGLGTGTLWSPPGGGLTFGETAEDCLRREFLEETGIAVRVENFLFACEFINNPLHAVELFFSVSATGGALRKGDDPELALIEKVAYLTAAEIMAMPTNELHGVFGLVDRPEDLTSLTGFFSL